MPLACSDTAGFKVANWRKFSIHELKVADEKLGPNDCHFGLNASAAELIDIEVFILDPSQKPLAKYGPRAIDMARRGGIVAETLWDEFNSGSSSHSKELTKFLAHFDDVVSTRKKPKTKEYKAGSMIDGKDVGGILKYSDKDGDKNIDNLEQALKEQVRIDPTGFAATGRHYGARWSKVAIEETFARGGTIHFHLDGMDDISVICTKGGDYSHNVTSRELRYIYRNWRRLEDKCVFYNGFSSPTDGLAAVQVRTPWPS